MAALSRGVMRKLPRLTHATRRVSRRRKIAVDGVAVTLFPAVVGDQRIEVEADLVAGCLDACGGRDPCLERASCRPPRRDDRRGIHRPGHDDAVLRVEPQEIVDCSRSSSSAPAGRWCDAAKNGTSSHDRSVR